MFPILNHMSVFLWPSTSIFSFLCVYQDRFEWNSWRDHTLLSVPRNYDPTLHPFEVCREYTRALNATKLERVFAKPFLASLDGHRDGVNCMAKHATSLSTLLSGSYDGEVTPRQPTNASPRLETRFVVLLELWRCALVDRRFCLILRWKCGIWLNVSVSARSKHMKGLSGAWLSAPAAHPFLRWVLPFSISEEFSLLS